VAGPAKSKAVEDVLRERADEVRRALDEALRPPRARPFDGTPLDRARDRQGKQGGRLNVNGSTDAAARLYEAMRYMVLGGGKKLRPCLVLLAAEACGPGGPLPRGGGSAEAAMPAACAVEMVHIYSLIHDDLPAMDNDDLRHGRPSCHKAFGEAMAILAGDTLLTEAFTLLATRVEDAAVCRPLVRELASAAGAEGMAGGQVADLAAERQGLRDARLLEEIHRRKTARLIEASVVMGAISARASDAQEQSLREYGTHLGLAFQVADDILDAVGETQVLGKTAGKDAAAGKLTFVSLFGLEAARRRARGEADAAVAALEPFGREADRLREVARFVVERTY
jgi:geranylgeranyl pyrophosphate synthase